MLKLCPVLRGQAASTYAPFQPLLIFKVICTAHLFCGSWCVCVRTTALIVPVTGSSVTWEQLTLQGLLCTLCLGVGFLSTYHRAAGLPLCTWLCLFLCKRIPLVFMIPRVSLEFTSLFVSLYWSQLSYIFLVCCFWTASFYNVCGS